MKNTDNEIWYKWHVIPKFVSEFIYDTKVSHSHDKRVGNTSCTEKLI